MVNQKFQPKASRRQREDDLKKTLMLEAAERVFEKMGFDKTTMDDVALAAGFSKATVYKIFPSKESLFSAMIQKNCTLVFENCEAICADSNLTFRQKIEGVLEIHLSRFDTVAKKQCVSSGAFHQSVFLGSLQNKHTLWHANSEIFEVIAKLYEEGVKQGQVIDVNPHTFLFLIQGFTKNLVIVREIANQLGEEVHWESIVADAKKIVLNGIFKNDK